MTNDFEPHRIEIVIDVSSMSLLDAENVLRGMWALRIPGLPVGARIYSRLVSMHKEDMPTFEKLERQAALPLDVI